jgi:adenylate cyclase
LLAERPLAGLSLDLLFWLRHEIAPIARAPDTSSAVVVSIDEETYRTPPFSTLPSAFWTRQMGALLDALVAADAKVVGFDVIYPSSNEGLVPGFDRPFLVALQNAARAGKVVLSEIQHQQFPIHPFTAQSFAVGNERNIRSVNLLSDPDEVIRRIPLTVERAGGGPEPSFALELASRAAGAAPERLPNGTVQLAGYTIPGSAHDAMLLNFADNDAIPTYSLADLAACATGKNAAFFHAQFAGKTVLIGAVLDVEDRKLTSMRFITSPEHGASGARCALPAKTGLFRADVVRDAIPGVYVFATAIDNLLQHDSLREAGPVADGALILLLALVAGFLAMRLPPLMGGLALAAGIVLWALIATFIFRGGFVLPLLAPPLAAALAFAALLGYRMIVADRDKRLLRSSFALYLTPALIDRMLAADRLPELGGEQREVTVFFSDLAGFTALSEHLDPHGLVALMNEYLTAMTEIIESEGGYVDKYEGDAIMAIFGAPLDDPLHALHAVQAALACRARLAALNHESELFQGRHLRARIGLNSGEALVGNIGSRRRFNYTALGDAVNLAARLEGACKLYGTAILASAATREAAGAAIAWREIDRVQVMGRMQPVTIFEPLTAGPIPPERAEPLRAYAEALAEYRAGNFAAALRLFELLAAEDAPARLFVERARRCLAAPPPLPWDAVTPLETK